MNKFLGPASKQFKTGLLTIISAFSITIFSSRVYAEYTYYDSGSVSVFQKLNQGTFFISYKWLNLDSLISYCGSERLSYSDAVENYSLENNYFAEFEYIPDTAIDILKLVHSSNTFSLVTSSAVFQVRYADIYENPPSSGYPVLVLTFPDASTQSFILENSGSGGIFQKALTLPMGIYQYSYYATNDEYERNAYELSGIWIVTSLPYDFIRIAPIDFAEVIPDNVLFSWSVKTDETDDRLAYKLFLGRSADKPQLNLVSPAPQVNATNYIMPVSLDHKARYFWYMTITNKYGAQLETSLFEFITGGNVTKFYNAPNPFNPARGDKTKFVFFMPETGTAQITVYSEYGAKIWQSQTLNINGQTSAEIEYNGKDSLGKLLYNGSYLAVLTKKYGGNVKTERCRILIIK